MTIKNLCAESLDTTNQNRISAFEAGFRYPLSMTENFSISHGADYSLFYRSMGESLVLAAEQGELPIATVAATIRELKNPSGKIHRCAYIGDLKYNKSVGASRKLLSLLLELQNWCVQKADSAIAIVMGGTQNLPDSYSGRLGLKEMKQLGTMQIYRIPVRSAESSRQFRQAERIDGTIADCFIETSPRNFICFKPNSAVDIDPESTSDIGAIWLGTADTVDSNISTGGGSIGCLQDTRKAKKLFREDGSEILNAHLTNFYYQDIESAASIIESSLALARQNSFEALFLSLDNERSHELSRLLQNLGATRSEAIIYGAGVIADANDINNSNRNWCINSSEV